MFTIKCTCARHTFSKIKNVVMELWPLDLVEVKLFSRCSNIQHFCGYIKQLPSLEDKNNKVRKIITRKQSKDSADKDL